MYEKCGRKNRGCVRSSARVTDFGMARGDHQVAVTSPNVVVGTPMYMSPEQIRGAGPSPSIDIYAAGVILYEILTGEPPFDESDVRRLLTHHLMTKVTPVSQKNRGVSSAWGPGCRWGPRKGPRSTLRERARVSAWNTS